MYMSWLLLILILSMHGSTMKLELSRHSDSLRDGRSGDRIPWQKGGVRFCAPYRQALATTQPSIQWVPVSFPGRKWTGRGVDHIKSYSVEVTKRLQLYLCSPFGLRGLF